MKSAGCRLAWCFPGPLPRPSRPEGVITVRYTLSPKQVHRQFHPKSVSSKNSFIQNRFHPTTVLPNISCKSDRPLPDPSPEPLLPGTPPLPDPLPPDRPEFRSCFLSQGGLSWSCGHGWRPWTTQIVRLSFSGLTVWNPGPHKMTSEKPKRTMWVLGLEPRPQFHEKTLREKKKKEKAKKSKIFGLPPLWPPPFGAPTLQRPHFFWGGLPPFWVPHFGPLQI